MKCLLAWALLLNTTFVTQGTFQGTEKGKTLIAKTCTPDSSPRCKQRPKFT